ncbi:hypothetical protein E1301_Tti015467 [Triplophysa tibetana]|uniref:Uncharacterized protein n=1 Tax=Triplophysa tibetana TaxID=1572043 RepID=A0A5A9PLL3_9TELE|nr:hypothetical protein E1301_Tti015467 [Triplophysa tibetana]
MSNTTIIRQIVGPPGSFLNLIISLSLWFILPVTFLLASVMCDLEVSGMFNPDVKASLRIRHWIRGFQLIFHLPDGSSEHHPPLSYIRRYLDGDSGTHSSDRKKQDSRRTGAMRSSAVSLKLHLTRLELNLSPEAPRDVPPSVQGEGGCISERGFLNLQECSSGLTLPPDPPAGDNTNRITALQTLRLSGFDVTSTLKQKEFYPEGIAVWLLYYGCNVMCLEL